MMNRMIASASRRSIANNGRHHLYGSASSNVVVLSALSSSSSTSSSSLYRPRRHYKSTAAAIYDIDEIETPSQDSNANGKFSIKGSFREGRASYLDTSATTPMDPRVLDKMMPYMVRVWCLHK